MLTPEDAAKPASSGVSIERADGVTFVPVSREHDSVRLPSPAFADPINCPLNSRRQGQCIGGRRRDVINGPGRPPFRDQQSTKWMADAVALGRPADVPVRQLGVKPPKPSLSVTDGARPQPFLVSRTTRPARSARLTICYRPSGARRPACTCRSSTGRLSALGLSLRFDLGSFSDRVLPSATRPPAA